MNRTRISGRLGREEGAAAVEFALIAGVLSMLVFGMLEYGLFFLQSQSLKAAAREGARVAAVGGARLQVKNAVISGSGGALDGNYDCFWVDVIFPPATSAPTHVSCGPLEASSTKYCSPGLANPTLGDEVVVTIPNGSGSTYNTGGSRDIGSNIVQAFQIDVPFLPHLNVHPTVTGSFRCEQ
jgi:hypothetical protein